MVEKENQIKKWFVDKILPWVVISVVSIMVSSYGWLLITVYNIQNNFNMYRVENDKKIAGVYKTLDFIDLMGYNGEKKVQNMIQQSVRDYVEKVRFEDIEKSHKLLRDIVEDELIKQKK